MDKARDELARPEPICAFLYGTATVQDLQGKQRIVHQVNNGGVNMCVVQLMCHFSSNLKEMEHKAPGWSRHLPWRTRLIMWLLIRLAIT